MRGFEAIRPPIMHKKAPFYNGALCVYATKIQ
nr:MAG TPA: tify domain [Caudoviricetes sp.]